MVIDPSSYDILANSSSPSCPPLNAKPVAQIYQGREYKFVNQFIDKFHQTRIKLISLIKFILTGHIDKPGVFFLKLILAKKGNASSMVEVALMYRDGDGVSRSFTKAKEWLEKAATQDNPAAHFHLGLMHGFGECGLERSPQKAIKHFDKATQCGHGRSLFFKTQILAKEGDVSSMVKLALMYRDGDGVDRSFAKAKEWYERAAAHNNPDAHFHLGLMHGFGECGLERSPQKAIKHFDKATQCGHGRSLFFKTQILAKEGDVLSMIQLACMYRDGQGAERSFDKAKEWYERAKAQDKKEVNFYLSLICSNELEK